MPGAWVSCHDDFVALGHSESFRHHHVLSAAALKAESGAVQYRVFEFVVLCGGELHGFGVSAA